MHLAKCIHNVEELSLEDCNIGATGVELLTQGILQKNQRVTVTLIYFIYSRLGGLQLTKVLDDVIRAEYMI